MTQSLRFLPLLAIAFTASSSVAAGLPAEHTPATLMVFTDEFDDGVVNQAVWKPVGGARLSESGGQLLVTRAPGTTGEFGVRFANPFPEPPPITQSLARSDRHIGHVTLLKLGPRQPATDFVTVMQVDPLGRHMDSTIVDVVTGETVRFDRDAFGALRMQTGLVSGTGAPHDSVESIAGRTYSLIPPACKGEVCDYGFDCCPLLIVAKWRIGASANRGGGSNLDPSINTTTYGGVVWTTNSADAFQMPRFEFQCGSDVPSVTWSLTPNDVAVFGGAPVTVHSDAGGLLAFGIPSVTVNGAPAPGVVVLDDHTMSFIAPPSPTFGLAEVVITSGDGLVQSVLDEDLRYFTQSPPHIDRSPLPAATAGVPYSYAFGGIDCGTNCASVISGMVPPGMSLSPQGVLSGTCSQAGEYAFHMASTDAIGQQDVRLVWVYVAAPVTVRPGDNAAFALITPNPSRGQTDIVYRLLGDAAVRLDVVDASGRVVREMVDARESDGEHRVTWDGRDAQGRAAPAGSYFYHLSVNGQPHVRKAVILR